MTYSIRYHGNYCCYEMIFLEMVLYLDGDDPFNTSTAIHALCDTSILLPLRIHNASKFVC